MYVKTALYQQKLIKNYSFATVEENEVSQYCVKNTDDQEIVF